MKAIRPINELGSRVQEAGRLRMGEKYTAKNGKTSMRALNTWRFTSPHRDCLDQLAAIYGGEVREWSDPKAILKNQFELYSTSSSLRVLVPPGGLSQWYEMWAGAGNVRRCDGIRARVPDRNEGEVLVDCICDAEQQMDCKPHTRLSVVIPEITFRGVWRLETKSWSAADELPAMEALVDNLQATRSIVEAELIIQQRSRMTAQGKRNFVVPVLNLASSVEALTAGQAGFGALSAVDAIHELNAGEIEGSRGTSVPSGNRHGDATPADDEPVEAEIMLSPEDLTAEARRVANIEMLDPSKFLTGVCLGVSDGAHDFPTDLDDDQLARAASFLSDVVAERILVKGVGDDGRLTIVRKGSR